MQVQLPQQGQDDYICRHHEFYWLGNVDRLLAQKMREQWINLRADVSPMHRSSLSARRRAEARAQATQISECKRRA